MDESEWIRPRRLLEVLAVGVLVSLVAAVVSHFTTGVPRILLEFVLGTWPDQDYTAFPAEGFRSSLWLTLGVFLRTLSFLAVPVLLGLWVVYVTEKVERRARMQMTEYLQIREGYLEERVY